MKTFNLKSITLVLFLLSASLQVWAATIPAGTVIYLDVTNFTGGQSGSGYYMSVTASANSSKDASSYTPKSDTWLTMTQVSGNIYSATVSSASTTGKVSFWNKNESNYDQVWQVNLSLNATYDGTNNLFTISSGSTYNSNRQSYVFSGSWSTYAPTPSVSLSCSPTSADIGANVTFTATGTNISDKTVTYKFDDITSGTTTIKAASSSNTCTTSWSTAGSKTVRVTMAVSGGSSYTATKSITITDPCIDKYAPDAVVNGTNVMFYIQGYDSNDGNFLVNSTPTKANTSYKITNTISYVNTAKSNLTSYYRISNNVSGGWTGNENTSIKTAKGGELFRADGTTNTTDATTAETTASVSGGTLSISTTTNSTTGVYNSKQLYIQYYIDDTFAGVTYSDNTAICNSITAGGSTARSSTFDVSGLTNGSHTLKTVLTDFTIYYIADTDEFTVAHSYTITLNGNGGTDGSATATYGSSTLTDITPATRSGYVLTGYFTNTSEGTKIINNDGTFVASTTYTNSSSQWTYGSNLTLYAQWSLADVYYTLTYGSGGNGTVTAKNTSTNTSVSSGASILAGTSITFTAAPSSHYKLKGWYSNSGCTTAISGAGTTNPYTRSITATQSVYAAFELNTCAITIDRNGGTAGATSVTATYGSTLPSFTASSRTGYTLNGYYTSASGGTKIINADGTLVASTSYANSSKQWNSDVSSLTLHAQWTEKMTTITINVSPTGAGTLTVGGSDFTAGYTTTAGFSTSRTVVATALPGYKFNNYTTSGNATGSASSNTYTLKGNGSAGTGTLTANFIRTYAFIEGRFRVYNSTRSTYTTTYASGGQWDESSTRIQMSYDATNHRFYLNTYMTPKELSDNHGSGCNDCQPYFYIKTSTSNLSLANVTSYLSSSSTTLSAAGSANKKTLGQSGSNANLRFDSSDESGYVILYFDESGVWYELEIPEYTLTMAKGTGGESTSPAVGAHTITGAQAISATASSGYRFLNWTASPDANVTFASAKTTNSNSVTLKGDATVTANFEPTYTLTVTSQTGGSITAPSGGTATVGPSQTTTITATKSNGYTFAGWTKVSGTATITNTNSLSTTVTGVSANTTVRADFTQDQYTVTVNSVGGTISAPSSGSYTGVTYGQSKTITAVNPNALDFVGWTADPAANATITNASLLSTTATIKGNVTLTATFREPITIYVSNEQCWDDVLIHSFNAKNSSNSDVDTHSGFPGNAMLQDANGWWYYTFDKEVAKVSILFANSSGTMQTSDINDITTTTYFKIDPAVNNRYQTSTTTSSYAPERCVEDYYTVIGDEAFLGSDWDLTDGSNVMTYNSTNSRWELRKVGVTLTAGKKYYKFVKNGCYEGSNCGQWPSGGGNAEANISPAGQKDLVFWLNTSNNTYGVDITASATYYINHPWGDGDGGWTKKQMTYSGSGSTYYASGILGANAGADIFNGDTKVKYFANNNSDISGYNQVSAGDNVVFTYNASNNTLSITCPTCVSTTKYWICAPTTSGSLPEQPYQMTLNPEDGLYYTDPVTQPYLWNNNGAKVNSANNCDGAWIDRNSIVNYASMTLGQEIQYIYDPDLNQLTVVDANTPQITLTATQAVNAAATESVITLRTTSTKTLTNATYSYSKISGPDGTLAASTTNTTTFTTTNEGTYNFQVTVRSDEGTFTANCTVRVKFKIIVYANVAAPGWSGTINLYYWATGVTAANHAMTSVGGKWYKYEVKGVPEFSFIVRQGTSTGSYQTVNIGPIDDDICIIVSSNIQSGGVSRLYSTTTDCQLYMRFASTYTQMKGEQNTGVTKTVYSNLFKQNGDQVSFYVGSTPNVKFQTFNSASDKWNAGTTVSTDVTGGDVYAGEYNSSASNKLKNFATYTGEFYVRTDGAPGGWSNYKLSSQAFFQFSRNDYYPNEWYNHYWCKWTGSGTNVKACVANEINPSVTDTLPDFYLTMSTNMRFEYDNETNYIGRQFLKGSGDGSDYLRIYASDDDNDNFVYVGSSTNTRIKKSNAQTFIDVSDWVYQIDVAAKPTGSDVNVYVLGRYPVTRTGIGAATDQDNNLGGYDDDGVTPLSIKIMGSSTTPDTYNMRLIYDYKTNRLMAAWYPQGNNVAGSEVTVDANFMISRYNDEEAETINMSANNGKIVSINQVISALTITKNAYNDNHKKYGNYYYWVSLPYDVRVRDIYGIGSYGKKWVVQRYRGDMRAKYGFLNTIETFWANMKQNATAKMEANRGYVIRIQLTDDDFKAIGDVSQVTLYFPSCNTEDIQLKNSTTALQTSVPEHLCEVVEPNGTPRKNWDSHWNVVGQPGLVTSAITVPTSVSGENEEEYRHHPKYYYKWSWSGGQGVYTPTAVSGTDNAFKTMYAYMVQYGGETITWQPNIETIDPSLAPRRRTTTEQKDLIISLTATAEREIEHITGEDLHSEYEQVTDFDRTLLTLSEQGTDNFVLNQDMSKTKSGKLNIYTVFDQTNTAGKVIPMDTKEVPVIVEINYENEVIFALDKDISKKTITFVDYLEGTETILNSADYRISLSAGKYDKRFAIRISERTEIPTDIAETANNGDSEIRLLRDGQQFYFEGLTQNETLRMFDATGKCLMSTTISNGEHFGVPSQGMYLLQVGTQTFKVAIN